MNRALDDLVGRIERSAALDPVADKLSSLAEKTLSAPWLRKLLSGTPAGHPAHPALVMVPMGAWLAAGYLDLAGGDQAGRAAQGLVGFGMAAAVPASLSGASDWSYTTGAERRVGLVHASGNYLALAMYAGSWMARRGGRNGTGKALAMAGMATVSVTGWLGGHLAYARGVGVDTTAFQVAPTEWTDVIAEADLDPDTPTQVHAAGNPVMLLLTKGELFAMGDRCTHRGAPLHEGGFADGCITCPWHGSTFQVSDGQVLRGPATRSQPVYETRTRYGSVQVRVIDEPGSLRSNPVS